jgi:hypothetical protein
MGPRRYAKLLRYVTIKDWVTEIAPDTVISCFPGCWVEDDLQEDPIDVLKGLVNRLESAYVRINSPHDLASLIILHCSGNLLGRTLDKDEKHNNLHFLDWFHLSLKEMVCATASFVKKYAYCCRQLNRLLSLRSFPTARQIGKLLLKR